MSAKDKIIKNIMKDKYVVSVNGKKYVEYGDVLYWLGTAGCLADGYDFVRQYIPSNKYEDDAFYDIADEFICWMWNTNTIFVVKNSYIYISTDMFVFKLE